MAHRTPCLQVLALLPCLLSLSACAKIGDPQPPLLLLPKPASDLSLRQYADRVMLTVSLPVQNTNGSRVTTLESVEILRMRGGRQNPATLSEEDFLARAQPVGSVSGADLAKFRKGGVVTAWDPAPVNANSLYKQGFVYAVRFINRKNQTAGLSNQVFIAPVPIPLAPDKLGSSVFPDHIQLSWNPPARNTDGSVPARVAGYNVYRSEDPNSMPPNPLNAAPLTQSEFEDRNFQFDKTYFYAVSVVGSVRDPYAESQPSSALAVKPVDTFPPGEPRNLNAIAESGVVILLWAAPDDTDVAGYRIYRKEAGSVTRISLAPELVISLSYRDSQVAPGKTYEYSVSAVDTHGNEGQPATVTVEVK